MAGVRSPVSKPIRVFGVAALAMVGAGVASPGVHLSCTAFMLRADAKVVTGKNLDWPVGLGSVLLNPVGLAKTAWVLPPDEAASWVSRYSSVTFNQLGQEFPLGGMNDAGLVVEELGYWPTRYPDRDGRPAVNELQWIQYQLDNFASVREVLAEEPSIRIAPLLFGLHYLVTDASGDAAVIEYLDGAAVIHSGDSLPVAALTNDTYRNLMRQLRQHVGFGGTRVPGPGSESPERFVRTATSLRRLAPGPLLAAVDSAMALLEDVAQDDTQWSIVYDPMEGEVHYRTVVDPAIRSIRLPDEPTGCSRGTSGIPIDSAHTHWNAWTLHDNASLVRDVFEAMEAVDMELPSAELRAAMARYPAMLTCDAPPSR